MKSTKKDDAKSPKSLFLGRKDKSNDKFYRKFQPRFIVLILSCIAVSENTQTNARLLK